MMPLEQFKSTPEFHECSDMQKLWLVTLIENGFDYTLATKTIYNAKDPAKFSYAVRHTPTVYTALCVLREWTPQDIFRDEVRRASRNKKVSVAQVNALKLRAEMNGWDVAGIPAGAPSAEISKPQPGIDCGIFGPTSAVVTPPDSRVPAGCRGIRSKTTGKLVAYLKPDDTRVDLADVEVADA